MSKVIDSFTIGGTAAGPSLPGAVIQKALGSTIEIDMFSKSLFVPTPDGIKRARQGDRVLAYDDGTFAVEYKEQSHD